MSGLIASTLVSEHGKQAPLVMLDDEALVMQAVAEAVFLMSQSVLVKK